MSQGKLKDNKASYYVRIAQIFNLEKTTGLGTYEGRGTKSRKYSLFVGPNDQQERARRYVQKSQYGPANVASTRKYVKIKKIYIKSV